MKDVVGYENIYGITSCGKVYSYKSKKFLKSRPTRSGYFQVTLMKNGERKTCYVHRLLAEAYIPNPNNLPQVDHIDNDKTHNYVNNLQWITSRDNNRKSKNKPILQYTLEGEFVREWPCANDVGRAAQTNIWYCLSGKYKQAYGYIWKYKN